MLLTYATHHCFKLYQIDVKSALLNGPIKKRCMWINHLSLKVKDIITMSIKYIRRSMGLSRHQEYDMNDIGTSLLKMVLGLVRQILLSSSKPNRELSLSK
jgi:hypothetical protein